VTPDTKTSCRMPRFWVYQSFEAAMDFTVRTRWSREVTVAAGLDEDILGPFDEYVLGFEDGFVER
jgi:hypothetical protein